jgi:hypothetical protein
VAESVDATDLENKSSLSRRKIYQVLAFKFRETQVIFLDTINIGNSKYLLKV